MYVLKRVLQTVWGEGDTIPNELNFLWESSSVEYSSGTAAGSGAAKHWDK